MSALTRVFHKVGAFFSDLADALFSPAIGAVPLTQQGVAEEQLRAYRDRDKAEMRRQGAAGLGSAAVYVFDDPELQTGDIMARLTRIRHEAIRLQYDCERISTQAAAVIAEAGAMSDRLKAARDKVHLIEPVVVRK